MVYQSETVRKEWDALTEPEPEANKPEPPDREPGGSGEQDAKAKLAAGMRREPGDVILALYECARDVARAAGIQTRVLIETMYEIDCTLSHIGGV